MSSRSRLRPADSSDIPGIFHVRTSVVESHLTEQELATIGITRESVTEMLDSGAARAWCIEVEDAVVGFSLAIREKREISALFVLPDFEGHGYGSELLNEAISWFRELGDEPIRLQSDPTTRAYRFYLKRGWRDLGHGPDSYVVEGDRYLELSVKGIHAERQNDA